MELSYTPQQQEFRREVQDWLSAHTPRGRRPETGTADAFEASRAWDRLLFNAGYSVLMWPEQYGGRGASLIEWLIFEEEYHRAGAPARLSQNGISLLAPTIFGFGTDEQREEHLRPMARGDVLWAQAWSEPGSGSDLASITSTARPDGDGWRLNGTKVWSSHSLHADRAFGLFRTGTRDSRHRGITYFLPDLKAEGVQVRPIDRLDGRTTFSEIVFDDVFVGSDQILGNVDEGWSVAMATTGSERGFALRSPGRYTVAAQRLLDTLAATDGSWDASFAESVVGTVLDAEAYELRTLRNAARLSSGAGVGSGSSFDKLFWSELEIRISELALDLTTGAHADSVDRDGLAHWLEAYVMALPGPIWGGTNEIQRNIIAQRVLQLPRNR